MRSDRRWRPGCGSAPARCRPIAASPPDDVARTVLRPLREIAIDPQIAAGQLIITPACGLAAFTRDAAIRALRTLRTAAGIVTEQLAD